MGCLNPSKTKDNKVLVIVGPSGVGKDTVMRKVFEKYPDNFYKAVTHTSRGKREHEKEGENYYYITKEDFENKIKEDFFVEHNFYNDNYYGTSKMELKKGLSLNKIMYLIIDINGANSIHNLKIPANFIAIVPKSFEVLEQRLISRGTESEDKIKGRVETAKTELETINNSPFFNYQVINDQLDDAVNDMINKLKELYPNFIKE